MVGEDVETHTAPSGLDILYIRPGGFGWGPVSQLVSLAGRLLEARVIEVPDAGSASTWQRAASLLPRGPRRRGRRLLVVAGNPAMVAQAVHRHLWVPGYESTAAWIIDSFWTTHIPKILRHRPHIDHLFITDTDLVEEWRGETGRAVSPLPWGSDTLALALPEDKPVDLLRLGRQPSAWDDDTRTEANATAAGLVFHGSPPAYDDAQRNQQAVRDALLGTKMVLAFSNLVSPAAYTHPTRDYVTARWTDGLAAGCLVVGAAPKAAADLFWPGATLDISPLDQSAVWPQLREAAASWSSERAVEQHRLARQRLDWRHRLQELCVTMGWPVPQPLKMELAALAADRTAPEEEGA